MPTTTMSVGEVAARSGLAVSALHFYERQGLITSMRARGNQRRYTRDVLRRLAVIHVAQKVGIPLKEIAEALATLPEGRTPTRRDWTRLSERWRAALDARVAYLTRLRDQMDTCIGCGCLSIRRCALYNEGDRRGEEGPGPRILLQNSAPAGLRDRSSRAGGSASTAHRTKR